MNAFLPTGGATGPFTFPAPYGTAGVRLTGAADCGGQDCLWPVGYSYWRNINSHAASNTMYIVLGFDRERGGAGPALLVCNKIPSRLYVSLPGTTVLRRFDVVTRQFDSAPGFDLNACPRPSVCPADAAFIFQPHSSDDDRIHSATVQDAAFRQLGCVVSDASAFRYVSVRTGYAVDADNYNPLPNASILLKFPLAATERPLGPVVHFNKRWDIAAANHIAHGNAVAGRRPEEQYACGSNASRVADMADEIVCFALNPNRHADGSLDVLVVGQVMTDLDAPGGNDLDGDD